MSHTPNTAFHQMSQMQKERDTYRDLCGELLRTLCGSLPYVEDSLKENEFTPKFIALKTGKIKSAITKAEKIMGDSK